MDTIEKALTGDKLAEKRVKRKYPNFFDDESDNKGKPKQGLRQVYDYLDGEFKGELAQEKKKSDIEVRKEIKKANPHFSEEQVEERLKVINEEIKPKRRRNNDNDDNNNDGDNDGTGGANVSDNEIPNSSEGGSSSNPTIGEFYVEDYDINNHTIGEFDIEDYDIKDGLGSLSSLLDDIFFFFRNINIENINLSVCNLLFLIFLNLYSIL
jgi:hypothetical protein